MTKTAIFFTSALCGPLGLLAPAQSSACRPCHEAIFDTYQRTGMGQSFRAAPAGEAALYYHAPSDTYFAMISRGGRFFEQQYQMVGGQQINLTEKSVDFEIGSGNHARTFLHRTERDTLIELPLGWYAENGGVWAMNPGYDRPDHEGFRRVIGYNCLFCHSAYPRIPDGSGPRSEPVVLSTPQGIDCQRCHGAGDRHVALVNRRASERQIREAIVNPARLPHDRQIEVCMQCHLETTSSPLPNSIVRFERQPFSYHPGDPLSDFMLHFDRAFSPSSPDDRFEINSSAYRLRQSKCFLKGGLTCITCHDPHDVPRGEQAAEHYDSVCRQCHSEAHVQSGGLGVKSSDCAGCHMPKRRTGDVVHAVMTDHLIARTGARADLLAAKPERRPSEYRGEVVPYFALSARGPESDELYTAVAQVSEGSNLKPGIARLQSAIAKLDPRQAEYYLQLGDALRSDGRFEEAVAAYQEAVRREPESVEALERLALGNSSAGRFAEAETILKRMLERWPTRAQGDAAVWTRLGAIYLSDHQPHEAVAALEKAVRIDPESPEAWNSLGVASANRARAEAAFLQAIRLQPNYAEAHNNLANLLAATGSVEEACRHFEAALRYRENYPAARYNYALALSQAGRLDEAQEQLETVLMSDAHNFDAHSLLANILGAERQLDAAIVHFEAAVRLKPDSPRANLDLGTALLESGRSKDARPYLTQAAKAEDPKIRNEASRLLRKFAN